jgi:uncharacterized heparinase superfamily protein
VANLGSIGVPRRSDPVPRAALIPGRLRSLFSVDRWNRRPEPRVRYGLRLLPGLSSLAQLSADELAPILARAEAVRARRFTHFGRTLEFRDRIDWQPAHVSERWAIALNALDELVALGVACQLAAGGDAKREWYEHAASLVGEWIAAVPKSGLGWSRPALVRRIPNLIYGYVLFSAELRDDAERRRVFVDSLYQQATALAAQIPTSGADRDRMLAGRALYLAGRFFDDIEARGWLEAATSLLWTQLREQVHEDGGHHARNASVHAEILTSYLEVLAIHRAANDDVPIWARKRIKGMADYLARLLHPDQDVVQLQGGALGSSVPPPRELLAVAAVLLHEPGLALAGELRGVWPALFLGDSARRVHGHLERRSQTIEPRGLRRSGFYVLPGAAGDVMVVDGGTPTPEGAGGALGYELSVGGLQLLVSSGSALEVAPPLAAHLRSSQAHNVLSVDGADQVVNGRLPVVSDVQWAVQDGVVAFTGSHDGFARLATNLRLQHRRRVLCLPGRFWIVCDELLGSGEHTVESFLHFHPETVIEGSCHDRLAFRAARSLASAVQIVTAGTHEARVARGVDGPEPLGWYRPGHGVPVAAPALTLAAAGRLPLIGYAIIPRSEQPASLRLEHDAFRLGAELRIGDEQFRLAVVQGEVELSRGPASP